MATVRTTLQDRRIRNFFDDVCASFSLGEPTDIYVVTHVLADRPFFLEALEKVGDLKVVFAKPKSGHMQTIDELKASGFDVRVADRSDLGSTEGLDEYLKLSAPGRSVALLDIGGYFAGGLTDGSMADVHDVIGVVEDTENGLQVYETAKLDLKVLSVARSPLKNTEDYLVGQAVYHSAEHVLRLNGQIVQGRSAVVFGFGKVGRSVAEGLRRNAVRVAVVDTNPIRAVEAHSLGFQVGTASETLPHAELIVGATGANFLTKVLVDQIRPGAFLFTVTSSDSELDLAALAMDHVRNPIGEHLEILTTDDHHFYLINEGNAVNFLHGAVVGDYIYLVQAEMIAALSEMKQAGNDVSEVSQDSRRRIADLWLRHFS